MDSNNRLGLDSRTVEELCELARDPAQAQELTEYLGAEQYRQLREALQSSPRGASRADRGTVVLLHGIMGSQIGKALRREWDIVWLNPFAVRDGNFSLLKLGTGRSRYGARGLLPMFYALLWARLKYWYGYNVVEFAYDWRGGVQESGDELVKFINQKTTGPVFIVAHSMGGLVARAALPGLTSRVQRIVQLASPNYGSFSPVVTLRGQNEFVNKILKFDTGTSVTDLISNTVSTFQGLYELMPAPARFSSVNLFDPKIWPASPTVNSAALGKAKTEIARLPGPDRRFVLIAGTNQETVTDMSVDSATGEFRFTTTLEGDGTVPLQFARFDASANVPTYLAHVTHNGIIADGTVSAAVDDILRTGETKQYPRDTGEQRRGGEIRRPLDVSALDPLQGRKADSLPQSEVRAVQREVLGPLQPAVADPADGGGVPAVGGAGGDLIHAGFKNVVVGRRRRKLRLVLAQGDITQMPAHAHVLGVFKGVTPSGPARAFDELLGGAVSDLFERQMFSGSLASVCFLPTYKTPVPGELLVFAGLGDFSTFRPNVVEGVAQQVVQSLLRVRVNELATVVFGGSFDDVQESLRWLLKGFIAGLQEADHDFDFQRIILCENDPQKFEDLQRELYQLASSRLFDDTEVEFDVIRIPDRGTTRGTVTLPRESETPVLVFSHLSVDSAASNKDKDTMYQHAISVLPPKSGTTVLRFNNVFSKAELDHYLRSVQQGAPRNLEEFGTGLAKLVLPREMVTLYKEMLSQYRVELVHDPLSSRIPWEALKFDDVSPAIMQGLSRKYESNQSPAIFSRNQQHNQMLRILLVYNPTEDLDGAEKEGDRILKVTAKWSGKMQVTALHGSEARRATIVNHLAKEDFDVLHYAGHAGYVAENPSQSGLVCAGDEILSGRDLQPLSTHLPPVIVLNACESGRVRRVRPTETQNAPASAAEAILNAGIMCFIATYWPVSDAGADTFADKFYEGVLSGLQRGGKPMSVGRAVLSARQALKAEGENDWANYMLYGDHSFILKSYQNESSK